MTRNNEREASPEDLSRLIDPEFSRALLRAYPDLLRQAKRLTGNRSDALDLLHDTIERGIRQAALFRSGGAPDRWLTTILRRMFIDRFRRARRRQRYESHGGEPLAGVARLDAEPRTERWEAFSIEDLRRAVATLPAHYREVYTAYAFEKVSHARIAVRLGLPEGTVATRIMRARRLLAARLEEQRDGRPVADLAAAATRARDRRADESSRRRPVVAVHPAAGPAWAVEDQSADAHEPSSSARHPKRARLQAAAG